MMHTFSRLFILIVFTTTSSVFAQQSAIYSNDLKDFNKAIALLKDDQFASAQIIFNKVQHTTKDTEIKSDCAYYIANCAIHLNRSNAGGLLERFLTENPASTKSNQAYKDVAYYYFGQKDYVQALSYFEKVQDYQLQQDDKDKFYFQKGYSYFVNKNKKEATTCFNKVTRSQEYGSQAKYYLGFMAYEGNDYTVATKYFDEIATDDKQKEKLSYYQADMNFKQGNFQKAIDLGQNAMAKSKPAEKSELNKIIGESYFNLKNYDKAILFLLAYKGNRGKWNNTDYYQLGYAYYKANNFENAIAQFNKIISGNDSVAQNAYYHLAESYLKLDKKQEALNAFKNASEMNFDLAIQEDARLNYAKLSYEIGNSYQSVPAVLIDFIAKYPKNVENTAVEKMLIDSYISSKNYDEAITLLEKNKKQENKAVYQKVTFYKGVELFTDRNYNEAIKLFKKSLDNKIDNEFTARATFWKAEAQSILEDYKNALVDFKQFMTLPGATATTEYKNSNYTLGYVCFKLKEYDAAADYFQAQVSKSSADKQRLNDSYLRLGDCRFVTSKYSAAMDAYNKVIAINLFDNDYAYFQNALCYGFLGRTDKKIEELSLFVEKFPKSNFKDDALYQLAISYVATGKADVAIRTYDRLVTEFPKGTFTAKAILRQGLIFYNSDRSDLAISKYKKVVADFPKTPEALEAVANARLIYLEIGKVDEYAAWVKSLDFVAVTDVELDNDTFESAYKQYDLKNYPQAITGFNNYISNFKKGIHSLQVNFFLAQSYYVSNQETKAVPNYEYVVAQSRNEFTEQALTRLGQILLKNSDKTRAIAVLEQLEIEAEFYQNKIFAQSNLMKCYYDKKEYAKAVVYAEKALANPKIEDNVKSDAQIIVARSAIQTGDDAKARAGYSKLLAIAKGELAAEATYYDAYFKNKDAKFELSNTVIQKLVKNYSGYKYFGSKGLIVMAKNFYGLKDSYQATYILENVIQNFTTYPDVIAEAKGELAKIKTEESKTNSSIK